MPATEKLIKGYERFRSGYYKEHKQLIHKLASEGQSPKICIISCCDSRVDTSVIFDTNPGDLFVIRNVANLVPPCVLDDGHHGTSAALEFAVLGLQVESIIVLGHSQCGGIKSLIDNGREKNEKSFISNWMCQLDNIREEITDNPSFISQEMRYRCCEQYSILNSLDNLKSFSWIDERIKAGKLKVHGWYYDVFSADLFTTQDGQREFEKAL